MTVASNARPIQAPNALVCGDFTRGKFQMKMKPDYLTLFTDCLASHHCKRWAFCQKYFSSTLSPLLRKYSVNDALHRVHDAKPDR